jgi:asparagine synthetase B (glutamine-hydrolysing)
MATYQNWLTTNISDKLKEKTIKFSVQENDIDYEILSFKKATELAISQLPDKRKFIPLSGGLDSEYVFRKIKETPIIIDTPCNQEELRYAYKVVEELNIEPIIIYKSESDLIEIFYEEIAKKLNSTGYNSVAAYIAGSYAKEKNSIVIIAEHAYDGVNEWDFYNDALLGLENSHYLLMYNREINEAMKKEYQGNCHQLFKSKLYDVELRPKMKYKYSEKANFVLKKIIQGLVK